MSEFASAAPGVAAGSPTEPRFTIRSAEPIEYSATPGVRFHLQVTEPRGLEVYTIALSAQIHIDPARRSYDEATRERLVELFGAPERWGATTHSFQWARVQCLVPSFTGSTAFTLEVPCSYDLEVASSKYFDAVGDSEVPLSFHFNGTVLYRGDDDRLQVVLVPWSCSTRWGMPVAVWKRTMDAHYPGGGWIRLEHETLAAISREKAIRGLHSYDATLRELLEAGRAP